MPATDAPQPFAQIPLDVLQAILIELGGTRGAVLAEVLASRYGVAKAEDTPINRQAIAHATGASRATIRQAITRLCRRNILARSAVGYRLNSDWSVTPTSRSVTLVSRYVTDLSRSSVTPTSRSVTPESRSVTPTSRSIRERERERESALFAPARTRTHEGPDPERDTSVTPTPTTAERRQLIAEADQMSAGAWHAHLVGTALDTGIQPDHLREAMRRARTRGQMRWPYVLGIARSFAAHGIDEPSSTRQAESRADIDDCSEEAIRAYSERIWAGLQRIEAETEARRQAEAAEKRKAWEEYRARERAAEEENRRSWARVRAAERGARA